MCVWMQAADWIASHLHLVIGIRCTTPWNSMKGKQKKINHMLCWRKKVAGWCLNKCCYGGSSVIGQCNKDYYGVLNFMVGFILFKPFQSILQTWNFTNTDFFGFSDCDQSRNNHQGDANNQVVLFQECDVEREIRGCYSMVFDNLVRGDIEYFFLRYISLMFLCLSCCTSDDILHLWFVLLYYNFL
jgi:hypothetical protein